MLHRLVVVLPPLLGAVLAGEPSAEVAVPRAGLTPRLCNSSMLGRDDALRLALTPPVAAIDHRCMANLSESEVAVGRSCTRQHTVIDMIMFGFEADTLEIRLLESRGIVNRTILIEAEFDHHGRPKPCVFTDILSAQPRYKGFAVTAECLRRHRRPERSMAQPVDWEYEEVQTRAAADIARRLPADAIVTFGHTDEVPNRRVWSEVKHCDGSLPTNVAVVNLMGLASSSTHSIYAARGHPHTLGSPAVMRAGAFVAGHPRGRYKNVWLVGGAHMTNYCYAGTRVLKEWTATEARPDMMTAKQPSCESQVAGCRRAAFIRGSKPIKITRRLPIALRCNPERYPEWWHRSDPRLGVSHAQQR